VGLVIAAGAIVVLEALGGSSEGRERPPLELLRGPRVEVDARLRPITDTIARRIEKIRGLTFERRPRVVVMGEARLAAVGRSITRRNRRRASMHPSRLHASRRLERASIEFAQVAGLLPPEFGLGPDSRATGLDRIGGAFDFPRNRIIIVPTAIQTRLQLNYTLAHELTHALEDQHFGLHLGRLTAPGEAAEVRRAVTEGTATFVQNLYRRRYLDDSIPLRDRLEGMRSVIAAGPAPYAVSAQAIFDYVDGGLFVSSLHRRAGDFRLVNRALRDPPTRSDQILHPGTWPGGGGGAGLVRLGVARLLQPDWRPLGGGVAGEEQALSILLAGAIPIEASVGASGWTGGRFAVWRSRTPPEGCDAGCASQRDEVGVVAFRWRHRSDQRQFALAVPAYTMLQLIGQPEGSRKWKIATGYVALGTAPRGSALAFAPTASLARELAQQAATRAADGGGGI
jgi:hypothetical protein